MREMPEMIIWTLLVVVGGVTVALGGALAVAADQTRQEEEAVARLRESSRDAA